MNDVLLAERSPSEIHDAAPRFGQGRQRRGRGQRRRHWGVLAVTVALVGGALGWLLSDAAQANRHYDRSRHSLTVTRATAGVVSRELATARADLHLLTQQVGDDTTSLSQDTSQLAGARAALGAAQAHVFEQGSLLNSLHECLGGVEQALNALAVGDKSKAADALKWVAGPCSSAVSASG